MEYSEFKKTANELNYKSGDQIRWLTHGGWNYGEFIRFSANGYVVVKSGIDICHIKDLISSKMEKI